MDRGPNIIKTLLFAGDLMDKGACLIKGNHDYMFEKIINIRNCENNLYYLGNESFREYIKLNDKNKKRVKEILSKMKPYYLYENYIFVHAGVNPYLPIESNNIKNLMWVRDEFYNNKAYNDKIVIFGHTITYKIHGKYKIWYDNKYFDKIGINCNCISKGKLACLDLTNGLEYYI